MADQKVVSIENLQAAMSQNNTKMKEWVNSQIADVKVIDIQWVEELPTTNISTSTIYLVKSDLSTITNNIYNEYVYKDDGTWEILGQVDAGSVDLTNYYNKEEIDALLENIDTGSVTSYTNEEITTMVSGIWGE